MASSLKELLEEGIVSIAVLPEKNSFNMGDLDKLKGYTVPLIGSDYAAKTPVMWNSIYEQRGLPVRNIMVVGDPANTKTILDALRQDPKYLGGGAGTGFKLEVVSYLDRVSPEDLGEVNIIVKEGGELVGYNTDAGGFVRSLEESLSKVNKGVAGSNFVVYGADGTARAITKLLAEREANHIRIVNRTYSKAVDLANHLNDKYGQVAVGIGEDMSRGVVLNSEIRVDALINASKKGSDGKLVDVAMYEGAHDKNETNSRAILEKLKFLRPDVIIADIVLPKSGMSVSLRLARSEGIENLLDGKPMVIYQAVPAYKLIEKAHPEIHGREIDEKEILRIFKETANK